MRPNGVESLHTAPPKVRGFWPIFVEGVSTAQKGKENRVSGVSDILFQCAFSPTAPQW
jgi:hypothetical protein